MASTTTTTATTATNDKVHNLIFDVLDYSFDSDQRSLYPFPLLFFLSTNRLKQHILGDIIDEINRTIAIAACHLVQWMYGEHLKCEDSVH